MVYILYIHGSVPLPQCGTSLTGCAKNQIAAATKACTPLKTAFYSCHRHVDVNDYIVRCRAAYCTSLDAAGEIQAQKAVCNVLSAYHKICTAVTGKAVMWRSATLCRECFIYMFCDEVNH